MFIVEILVCYKKRKMVDPNRKINRLTDKDIEFLEECEREFGLRYTEEDSDFMDHCSKPLDDPPIVENWNFGGGGDNNSRNDGGSRNYNRGSNRHNRNWRGYPGGDHHRQKDRSFRPRRGFGGGGEGYHRNERQDLNNQYNPPHRPSFNQNNNHTPMNVRRDYNNFVAASKDD